LREIIIEKLLHNFPSIICSNGKTNSSILKNTIYVERISDIISPYFETLIGDYKLSMKIQMLFHNTDINSNVCEVCSGITPFDTMTRKFKPFCGSKCASSKGSSKFEKIKKTNIERYGVSTNLVLAATREGMIKKYGGVGSGSSVIKNKIIQTNLERYGVENVFQNAQIKEKIKETHQEKYNGKLYQQQHICDTTLQKITDYVFCSSICDDTTKTFSQYAVELGITVSTLLKYIRKFDDLIVERKPTSMIETVIGEMLDKHSIAYLRNDRNAITSELDIYIPTYNVGIEVNGLYWHSDTVNPDSKHLLKKYEKCKNSDIHLLHFFEHEIVDKYEIVESMILNKLGKSTSVYARKLKIRKLDNTTKNIFFNKNHISGDSASSINYGLVDSNNVIYAAISFSKSRFSKSEQYEIVRFANLLNHTVVGGFSKLFKYCTREYQMQSCVTFADKRFSYNGNVYVKNGFKFSNSTLPSYFYFKSDWNLSYKFLSRYQTQKHKLGKLLNNYDNTISEYRNMKNSGWHRIWDCGNYKFTWNSLNIS